MQFQNGKFIWETTTEHNWVEMKTNWTYTLVKILKFNLAVDDLHKNVPSNLHYPGLSDDNNMIRGKYIGKFTTTKMFC